MGIQSTSSLIVVCDRGSACERISPRLPAYDNPLILVEQAIKNGWAVGLDAEGHFLTYCSDRSCQRRADEAIVARGDV